MGLLAQSVERGADTAEVMSSNLIHTIFCSSFLHTMLTSVIKVSFLATYVYGS